MARILNFFSIRIAAEIQVWAPYFFAGSDFFTARFTLRFSLLDRWNIPLVDSLCWPVEPRFCGQNFEFFSIRIGRNSGLGALLFLRVSLFLQPVSLCACRCSTGGIFRSSIRYAAVYCPAFVAMCRFKSPNNK